MESLLLRRRFSLNVLIRMLVLALVAAGLLVWKLDFINEVYFRDQLTATGLVINGAIVTLFLVGLLKMVASFLFYAREEAALARFVARFQADPDDPLDETTAGSLVGRRYQTLLRLHNANTPINHAALAATLVASESTRNSLPKFINNILILSGVFGTIVSLSIALIGASDLLESAVNVGGMGMVVHGMSTALSTTITAIVCFVYFGYFYLKLNDVQTNLLSGIEQVTTSYLVPRFQVQTDTVLYEFIGLIRSLQQMVNKIEGSQSTFQTIEQHILDTLDVYQTRIGAVASDLVEIRETLRAGFRLPEDERE